MKKSARIITIIAVAFICIALIAAAFSPMLYFLYVSKWRCEVQNFSDYKADFERMVNVIEEYFKDKAELRDSDDGYALFVDYDVTNKLHYLSYDNQRIKLSDQEQSSLEIIADDAFCRESDADFSCIRYCYGRISFGITTGYYSLVYSFDDSKPVYVNTPNENKEVSVKKIEKQWYHVVFDY